ncbi:orotate phosphoribosyltransferase [Salinisphaera sp. PC39]|uniref:orotate phosphoribosyltransferase n=1 Tax=Salinisphaera sp. PC39 TaxID=1304156 RepID=UPI0033411B8A
MHDSKRDFLDLAFEHGALKLGEFTLKSGRVSPYFFNLGAIASGAAMARLADSYAAALEAAGIDYDALFGPAYKGIPLATAVACALAGRGRDVPFAYNRKEAKDHGEGGVLVGAPLSGRVVIVDDVITAGTAVREAVGLIEAAGAEVAALLVALDRQERADGDRSAIQTLAAEYGIPTVAVATLDDLLAYLRERGTEQADLARIEAYRERFGVAAG